MIPPSTPARHRAAMVALVAVTITSNVGFVLYKASVMAHQPYAVGESSWFLSAHDLAPRFFLGALLLLALFGRSVMQLTRTEWRQTAFMAVTSFAGCMLQLDGLQRTSAATTSFLTQFYVVLIPLWWALLHRKRPDWRVPVACVLVLAGVAILARVNWETFRIGRGETEVLLGAVFFSFLLLSLNWPAFSANRAERTSAAMFLIEGALFSVLSLLTCREPANLVAPYSSPTWLTLMVASAVLGSVGPFVILNHWQRFITATEAGVLYSFGPVVATLSEVILPAVISGWAGIAYANQPLTMTLVVGGALILVANILLQWKPARALQPVTAAAG
ncbi:MAG: EamA family transporter [Opitutaceae bacterium]|nr:EamA family transporter [Opitutaceae bacterium]